MKGKETDKGKKWGKFFLKDIKVVMESYVLYVKRGRNPREGGD